ncbi:MAG: hypothetical protein EXQ59_04885 [Acidobacteria bacterium]|nr:hypothetical protein [Acidobacteriota bacterium]
MKRDSMERSQGMSIPFGLAMAMTPGAGSIRMLKVASSPSTIGTLAVHYERQAGLLLDDAPRAERDRLQVAVRAARIARDTLHLTPATA